jgi:hypothetical protein
MKNKIESIFTCTSICIQDAKQFKFDYRTFGFFFTEEEARMAVKENSLNMIECYYDYLVIEQVFPGIHTRQKEIAWFKAKGSNNWISCKRPRVLKGFVDFGL